MNSAPFSIIVPTYNGKEFLGDLLESIKNQSLLPKELIVVDDCSTDSTSDIVFEWSQHAGCPFPVVQLKTNRNSGSPAEPIRLGIENARNPWIAILEQDDLFHPDKIRTCNSIIQAHPHVKLITHGGRKLENRVRPASIAQANFLRDPFIRRSIRADKSGVEINSNISTVLALKHSMYASGFPGLAFEKDAFMAVGGIPYGLKIATDFALLLNMSKSVPSYHCFHDLYYRRSHANNLSHASSLSFLEVLTIIQSTMSQTPELWRECEIQRAISWRTVESAWNLAAFGFSQQASAMIAIVRGSMANNLELRFYEALSRIMPIYRRLFMPHAKSSQQIADEMVEITESIWRHYRNHKSLEAIRIRSADSLV